MGNSRNCPPPALNNTLSIVVAFEANTGGIGRSGVLPWKLPDDMRWFRELTLYGVVIMGRKTWDSLKHRPLHNRINIIISSSSCIGCMLDAGSPVVVVNSFEAAVARAATEEYSGRQVFVIGGESVYRQAMDDTRCTRVYATIVRYLSTTSACEFDAFFPHMDLIDAPHWMRSAEATDRLMLSDEVSGSLNIYERC